MNLFRDRQSMTKRNTQKFAAEVGRTRAIFYDIFAGIGYISLLIITFVVVLWFLRQMNDSKKFAIHQIEFINPLVHIDTGMVKKISLPFTEQNFFKVNIFELKRRLSRLPWVYQVTVLRTWPNSLSVRVKEQEPIARLPDNRLLNKHLEVFTVPVATLPSSLPEFKGPAGQLNIIWQNYLAVEKVLKPIGLHVVYFELSERQSWRLKLNNGLMLILGRSDGIDRLSRFVGVYHQILASHNLGTIDYIDLRYSTGMAVAPRPLESAPK